MTPPTNPQGMSTGEETTGTNPLPDRRRFLQGTTAAVAGLSVIAVSGRRAAAAEPMPEVSLNDVQSQLNPTQVHRVLRPTSIEALQEAVEHARSMGHKLSVAGGRHSMGGQQFGEGNLHVDATSLHTIISLDTERGLVKAEAGIEWPELIEQLHVRQSGDTAPWTIREKQTGVDAVTLGGSLSSNIHGRSLAEAPMVGDIESFELIDATGQLHHCSRTENSQLFSLAIGGYGLFGLVATVTLRLVRRFKVRRRVEVIPLSQLLELYQQRVDAGCVFGDCQYATDLKGTFEEHRGVFPCYEPVDSSTALPESQHRLVAEDWARLYKVMRTDKRRAFDEYAQHYLRTDGQIYWSDTHQLAGDFVGHRKAVDARQGTEMITEVYLPHDKFYTFMRLVRDDLVKRQADITYGTIRFIEADTETFLPWARQRSVCVVINLHVRHTPEGIAKAKGDFRQIIDRVIQQEGSFYLTYHRWATSDQVRACHPRIHEFFELKRTLDPEDLFQSDWYRHYATAVS